MKRNISVIALLLCGFVFVGSFSAFAYSVDSSGSELVANVLKFQAIPGDQHIALSWDIPSNADFSGVSILRSDQNYEVVYSPDLSIYKGNDKSFIDINLENGRTYYYTIFAYNSKGINSSGSIAKATPKLPSLTDPFHRASSDFSDTGEEKPHEPAAKIDKIELNDFYYYLVLNNKVLQVGLNDLNELHVTGDSKVLIEIPSDIFAKPVNVISAITDESSFLMTLIPDKNKYQLVLATPKNSGEQQLRFVAVFKDKTVSDIKTKLFIDSKGVVYQKGSSFFGFGKKQEMRIENAEVTLYQKDNDECKLWDASKYFQENPQTTNSSGEYAFFLPKGEYYLEVAKAGFKKYKSESFTAEQEILNQKIEIRSWIDFRFLAVIIFAAIVLIGFLLRKKLGMWVDSK